MVSAIRLADESETLALGARLADALRPGDVVRLIGDLGAGKTTLARGLIRSRLGDVDVPSPTYTLVQTYDWPIKSEKEPAELWHCDLYRLACPDDAYELGLIDAIGEAVLLIEWPDRLGSHCPDDALSVTMRFDGDARMATLSGWGDRHV